MKKLFHNILTATPSIMKAPQTNNTVHNSEGSPRYYNFVFIWGSFICFLTLYILSKGKGIVEPEAPFFAGGERAAIYHTSLIYNIISFLFITLLYYYIWRSMKVWKDSYYKGGWKWPLALISLGLLVTKAWLSQPLVQWDNIYKGGVYVVLGLLSIPSVLFILSWLCEQGETLLEKKVNSVILGRRFMAVCFSSSIIGLCICIYSAFSLDVWGDEGFTLHAIEQDWMITMATGIDDVHPPLYLVIFKIIADSIQAVIPSIPLIMAAKLGAVLPHVILVILCMTVVRRKWGNYVAGLGALSMVCMPTIMYHSQELRLYSWSMLWVTCAWLFVHSICCQNRWRDWFGLIVFSVLTAYTLYIACVAVGVLWLFLGIWCYRQRQLKKWLLAAVMTFFGILPWSLFMVKMVGMVEQRGYWMPPIDFLILYDLMLSPTRDILISILLLVCAAVAYASWRKTKSVFWAHALLGMGLVYFTVMILCGISCVSTPVITSRIRYVVPMLACMWLGTLVVCNAIPRLRILMSLLVCFVSLSEARSFLYVNEKGRQEAASFRDFLSHNEPAEIIIPVYKSSQELAAWYLRSPLIIGNKPCRLLHSEPTLNECTEDEEAALERTKAYAENNKLPSFLLPLLCSYRQALHTSAFELQRSTIRNVDIERMIKSEHKVYFIFLPFRDNEPDMEATEKLLAESNIRLNKSPVLNFKINCGKITISLYELDLK